MVTSYQTGPCPTCGAPPKSARDDVGALTTVVAYLLDAMKWHLRGATGTDQRSLDHAQSTFEKHFLQAERSRPDFGEIMSAMRERGVCTECWGEGSKHGSRCSYCQGTGRA